MRTSINTFTHLQGLKLAHSITNQENFQISVVIGADFYWTFVGDHIVRGEGPTAQQSKPGYLLSGPVRQPSQQFNTANALNVAVMLITVYHQGTQPWTVLVFRRDWPVQDIVQSEDAAFLQHYQNTCISQASDRTYSIQQGFHGSQTILTFPPTLLFVISIHKV